MPGTKERGRQIRDYILEDVDSKPPNIAQDTATYFGISRQAANKHLSRLVKEGLLTAQGTTRNRQYSLAILDEKLITVPLTNETAEDIVWRREVEPLLSDMPKPALDRYPGWEPKYCREHSPANKGAKKRVTGSSSRAKKRVSKRTSTRAEENLTLAEVLEKYTDGPGSGVFTDGSSNPNPGPGGWGWVWVEKGKIVSQGPGVLVDVSASLPHRAVHQLVVAGHDPVHQIGV